MRDHSCVVSGRQKERKSSVTKEGERKRVDKMMTDL